VEEFDYLGLRLEEVEFVFSDLDYSVLVSECIWSS